MSARVDELVGRTDLLKKNRGSAKNEQAMRRFEQHSGQSVCTKGEKVTFDPKQVYDFDLEKTLDERVLITKLGPALENGRKAKH